MTFPRRKTSVIFAGGGTGGHLFPAVALADRLTQLLSAHAGVDITFVGAERGIEYRLRDTLGYPLRLINIRGIERRLTLRNLLAPFLAVGALLKARAIIRELQPVIVVGTGGYVSWPLLKAAGWLGVTTVLQEQNSFPGVATRGLAARAARVYLGFAEAKEHLPVGAPCMTTGNPVRPSVVNGDRSEALKHFGLSEQKTTILILGGSQGARSVNQAILNGLGSVELSSRYQLLWQTGKRDYTDVVNATGEKSRSHTLFPFENRMDLVYAAADIAIARAGAITLAELEACRVPSVLIPYPQAAGDHQRKNARAYAAKGFAEVIDPDDLARTELLGRTIELCESGRRERMQTALDQAMAGRKPAVDVIAEDIVNLIVKAQEATGGS
jgi:UDP-N-acetylglucosamine--N-acetylmuramyl-(pentapeptide) pyrophosphoryl-undecaprenol N-acetylglucosamine transferase